MTADKKVLMGRIGRAHGVAGQVRIKAFTADPLSIADYGPLTDPSGRTYRLTDVRPGKEVVVARIEGVGDRAAAEALNGTELYAERSQLPPDDDPDTFYHTDLVGLEARDETGAAIGHVDGVYDFGAGDILDVAPKAGGKSVMVPFTRDAVPQVDIDAGFVAIRGFEAFADTSADEDESP